MKVGFVIIALLFFASGFSSLIYQVVWNRLLVFLFGSTTFATASVLAVFMGGLAAGSFIGGRLCMKTARPLLWYGILEGIVGVWALAVPHLLDAAIPLYKTIWGLRSIGFVFPLLRLLVAAGVLFIPTACMGATLPLLAKYVSNNPLTIGLRVGSLYAINTLGALCGAALAGFALLPAFGLGIATGIAAAINIALCLIVVLLSQRSESAKSTDKIVSTAASVPESSPDTSSVPSTPSGSADDTSVKKRSPLSKSTRLMIILFGLSGAISMVYEVGWTRALLLVIGSSTYAFTCMLTTFLIGIFLGSAWCARVIDKRKDPILVFALIEIAVAAFAILAMQLYGYLPIALILLAPTFANNPDLAIFVKFLLAASTFVPLTLGLGATFPAVVKSCVRELDQVGESVGTIYSANTLGAIGGALLSGFILVPLLGVEKMLVFAAAFNMLIGVVALFFATSVSQRARTTALAFACALTMLAIIYPNVWDRTLLLLGQPLRRANQANSGIGLLFERTRKQILGDMHLVYYADGVSATVGVFEHSNPPQHLLNTNGNIDGTDQADMVTQTLLAAIPLMWRPQAESSCVVGWGTGVSSGVSTLFPLKEITSIELEQRVIDASQWFHKVNHNPEADPRTKIEINDGRNFLIASDKKYDVIASEPSNPWQAGVCNLFTLEFFDICHSRLKPGGILSIWAQSKEVSPDNIRGVLASMRSVFKNVEVFRSGDSTDIVILASDGPLTISYEQLKKVYDNPVVQKEMAKFSLATPEALLACMSGSVDSVAQLASKSSVNTDDHNYFEYSVQKTYESKTYSEPNRLMFEEAPLDPRSLLSFGDMAPDSKAQILNNIASRALADNRPKRALEWANWSLEIKPTSHAYAVAGLANWNSGEHSKGMDLWNKGLALWPDDTEILSSRALAQIAAKDYGVDNQDLKLVIASDPNNKEARFAQAAVVADRSNAATILHGDLDALLLSKVNGAQEIKNLLSTVVDDSAFIKKNPNALYLYSLANAQLADASGAEKSLRKYVELQPNSAVGPRTLGSLLWTQGKNDIDETGAWMLASVRNRRDLAEAWTAEAQELARSGKQDEAIAKSIQAFTLSPGDPKVQNAFIELSANSKDEKVKRLLKVIQDSRMDGAAFEATPMDKSSGENIARLVELMAAGFMLYLLLKKNKKQS